MDFGQVLSRQLVLATAYLLANDAAECLSIAEPCLSEARSRLARRSEARLQILIALARGDEALLTVALSKSASIGEMGILELADAIANHLDVMTAIPDELNDSIARWPARWLPALRRQMDKGDVPSARVAARLLDRFGELEDIGRLRAYARTYRRRGRLAPLGLELAQRVSPRLQIRDLGRVTLLLADRTIALAGMRRKPASLLMYLITRPGAHGKSRTSIR